MCFYHNYDWGVGLVTHETLTAVKLFKCNACGVGDCECPDGNCCQCSCPDFGNTYEHDVCIGCDKFLKVIEAVELDEGCTGDSTRPSLSEMVESIRYGDMHDSKRYWKRAREMFPELVLSGYLAKLWRKVWRQRYVRLDDNGQLRRKALAMCVIVETLIRARQLLLKGWCKGASARDQNGVECDATDKCAREWCIDGATWASCRLRFGRRDSFGKCLQIIEKANRLCQTDLSNDRRRTKKADVIRWMTNAIEYAKKRNTRRERE
jgi:hypothetical protein